MNPNELASRFRIDRPKGFHLKKYDPGETLALDKASGKDMLAGCLEKLAALQEKLYAQNQWSLLVVLQAMDAAGKDSVIEHVMSGLNPQGCTVHSFKVPSGEELDHDFLWRAGIRVPRRGEIGIFNRSHYEEVLVVRVHPELLKHQRLPAKLAGKNIWAGRYESIRSFEGHLARSGTVVLKFFLNVSKDEQRKRFLDRLNEPAKRWKFSMGDVAERKLWPRYMAAYQEAIRETSRPEAPWFVVPADNKWFTRLVVASAMVDALEGMKLEFPKVDAKGLAEMETVRKALETERGARGKT